MLTHKKFGRKTIFDFIKEAKAMRKQASIESKLHKVNKVQIICELYDKDDTIVKKYKHGNWVYKLKNDMYQISEGRICFRKVLEYKRPR